MYKGDDDFDWLFDEEPDSVLFSNWAAWIVAIVLVILAAIAIFHK